MATKLTAASIKKTTLIAYYAAAPVEKTVLGTLTTICHGVEKPQVVTHHQFE